MRSGLLVDTIVCDANAVRFVSPDTATEEACRMEHLLSPDTVNRLAKFVEFVSTFPQGQPGRLEGFNYYMANGEHQQTGSPT